MSPEVLNYTVSSSGNIEDYSGHPRWMFGEERFTDRQKGYWVVWSPGHGEPRVKHDDCQAARNEAMRLAEENPGQRFIVMRADSEFSISEKKVVMKNAVIFQ